MTPFDKDWTKPDPEPVKDPDGGLPKNSQGTPIPGLQPWDRRALGLWKTHSLPEEFFKGGVPGVSFETTVGPNGHRSHTRDVYGVGFVPYQPHPEDVAALAYKAHVIHDLERGQGWRIFYSTDPDILRAPPRVWSGEVPTLQIFEPERRMTEAEIVEMKKELEKYTTGLHRFMMVSGVEVRPLDEADTPTVIQEERRDV